MMDAKYYAELSEDIRMKIFVLQHILGDRGIDLTASEIIDFALDYMKKTIDCSGWENVCVDY